MKKMPLVEGLLNYISENKAQFAMPGHKQGKGFFIEEFGMDLRECLLKMDLTEVDGLDNLHKPEGIIKEALVELSKYYKSTKSYFLVNGSTSGNLSMIFASLNEGDKVLVQRDCHRSIFNGIILRKLKPIYMNNAVSHKINVPIAFDKEEFIKKLDSQNIKAIILTYPNYYGVAFDLEYVMSACKKRGVLVLIDSAHGAHFGAHSELPKSAVELGADVVVMSSHKTLPSLTQTAFLHVNNESLISKIDFYISLFSSTSPSYMFMASMDYGRAFLQYEGEKYYGKLLGRIKSFKKEFKNNEYINIVDSEFLSSEIQKYNLSFDESRIVINLKCEISGHKFSDYLNECGIQVEMSDYDNVVLIPSPFNFDEDFIKLESAIKKCDFEKLKEKKVKWNTYSIPQSKMIPSEVLDITKESVSLKDSEMRICGENIVPYPPGVPLLMMGELITKEHIKIICELLRNKVTVLGVNSDKIVVVK